MTILQLLPMVLHNKNNRSKKGKLRKIKNRNSVKVANNSLHVVKAKERIRQNRTSHNRNQDLLVFMTNESEYYSTNILFS